jgi:hypothetical protein
MGLSESLAGYAVRAAHVLVVETPGHWVTRAAVERHLLDRGWRIALNPAEADVLAVCGTTGPELAENVERLWQQMPGPRARVDVPGAGDAGEALARAERSLVDLAEQHDDAHSRAVVPHEEDPGEEDPGEDEHDEHAGHEEMDHGEHGEHGGHEEDHGGHSGHGGHGGMDMAPGGIPLAEGGEDRDGLEMDVLHVRLGPVLPYWPAGLVLGCTLQGDLVVEAEATTVDGGSDVPDELHLSAARRCDNAVSLLALAGWDDAAGRARRVRDLLLGEDADAAEAMQLLDDLQRRVRRSWSLRWALRRLAPLDDAALDEHGLPARLGGDTHDRALTLLERARQDVVRLAGEETGADHGAGSDSSVPLDAIAHLVTGLDLATARLVVASLDLDPVPAASGVTRA